MKAWLKKLFYAAVATFVSLGGCNSVKTCPLPAPVVVQGTAPAVPDIAPYPVIQVVDAEGNQTAEIIDNGVVVEKK